MKRVRAASCIRARSFSSLTSRQSFDARKHQRALAETATVGLHCNRDHLEVSMAAVGASAAEVEGRPSPTLGAMLKDCTAEHAELITSACQAAEQLPSGTMPKPLTHMTLNAAVNHLTVLCRQLQEPPETEGRGILLSSLLSPLMQLRGELAAMDIVGLGSEPPVRGISPANAYDSMLGDITPEDLRGHVSNRLGVPYLSPTQQHVVNPAVGKMVWTKEGKRRIFFTLPVSHKDKSVMVHFFLDHGAPFTYVSSSVFEALDVPERYWNGGLEINRVWIGVQVSETTMISYNLPSGESASRPCHFAGLNVLGMNYLDQAGAKVLLDMGREEFQVSSTSFRQGVTSKALWSKLIGHCSAYWLCKWH